MIRAAEPYKKEGEGDYQDIIILYSQDYLDQCRQERRREYVRGRNTGCGLDLLLGIAGVSLGIMAGGAIAGYENTDLITETIYKVIGAGIGLGAGIKVSDMIGNLLNKHRLKKSKEYQESKLVLMTSDTK